MLFCHSCIVSAFVLALLKHALAFRMVSHVPLHVSNRTTKTSKKKRKTLIRMLKTVRVKNIKYYGCELFEINLWLILSMKGECYFRKKTLLYLNMCKTSGKEVICASFCYDSIRIKFLHFLYRWQEDVFIVEKIVLEDLKELIYRFYFDCIKQLSANMRKKRKLYSM